MLLNGTEARKKWPGLNIPHSSHIDDSVVVLNPSKITIGHHVRIDAFCVLSPNDGYITIGNYIHIAVHCSLFGSGGIEIKNFANIAAYSILQSASDDFYGSLIGPTIPKELTNVKKGKITINEHVILGMRTTVFPSVDVAEGVGTGAHTLLTKSASRTWKMYFGVNKLLKPDDGHDRDLVTIYEKSTTLIKEQPRSGWIKPEDFGFGEYIVHFDEPQEYKEVILLAGAGSSDRPVLVSNKDKYGFTVLTYGGSAPKNSWRWELSND